MNIQKITGESIQGLKKAAKNISDGTPPKMIEDGGEKMAKGMDAIANSGMAHVITRKKKTLNLSLKQQKKWQKDLLKIQMFSILDTKNSKRQDTLLTAVYYVHQKQP